MKKQDIVMCGNIITVMRSQFRVWQDTPNADDILVDTARAIGHQIFNLKGNDLDRFEASCKTPGKE